MSKKASKQLISSYRVVIWLTPYHTKTKSIITQAKACLAHSFSLSLVTFFSNSPWKRHLARHLHRGAHLMTKQRSIEHGAKCEHWGNSSNNNNPSHRQRTSWLACDEEQYIIVARLINVNWAIQWWFTIRIRLHLVANQSSIKEMDETVQDNRANEKINNCCSDFVVFKLYSNPGQNGESRWTV